MIAEKLRNQTIEKRLQDMDLSRRSFVYQRIQNLLDTDRCRVFELLNYGFAILDDNLDQREDALAYLDHLRSVFKQSTEGSSINVSTDDEHNIRDLGYTLRRLSMGKRKERISGRYLTNEVINFWNAEEKNIKRRFRILNRTNLDEITLELGKAVAAQFLFLLDPSLKWYELEQLARGYGFGVKLADNLLDFEEDIKDGFVNVPLEEIHNLYGVEIQDKYLKRIDKNKLGLSENYVKRELERIERIYHSMDDTFLRICISPIWHKRQGLFLLRELAYCWLNQVKEKYDNE